MKWKNYFLNEKGSGKQMKKLLVLLALMLGLVACGQKEEAAPAEEQTAVEQAAETVEEAATEATETVEQAAEATTEAAADAADAVKDAAADVKEAATTDKQ